MESPFLGRHVLAELYGCTTSIIKNNELIEKIMKEAAEFSGATIVDSNFHYFNPFGVSGVIIIAESHLTIHTWPEFGFASVDVYTCGNFIDPWKAVDYLSKKLIAQRTESLEVQRGMKNNMHQFKDKEMNNFPINQNLVKKK